MRLPLVSLVLLLSAAGQAGAQVRVGRFDRLPGDPLLVIIDRVPSFAGMWLDSDRNFHGSLTNLNDSSKLREMLEVYQSDRNKRYGRQPGDKGIIIEKANYSYAQLFDWKCTIERAVLGVDGFQSGGISEPANKVHIGVVFPGAIDKVRQIVKGLNIPLNALAVELEGRLSLE